MSASLVGSEMCIRDRRCTAQLPRGPWRPASGISGRSRSASLRGHGRLSFRLGPISAIQNVQNVLARPRNRTVSLGAGGGAVSYTHLRAHETSAHL
eukprot:7941335-Alexandrium_andersonii.AAC.1